jgi:hypothetical protein
MVQSRPKIEGMFYPLQHAEWLTLSQRLSHSELRVLYHLRTLDPFGDKFKEASTKTIAEDLGISQRTREIFGFCSEGDQEFRPAD